MKPLDPRDYLVNAAVVQSNIAYRMGNDNRHMILSDLVNQISHHIATSALVETTKGDFSTETRMSVFVIPPEKFYELVHREATRIAHLWGCKPIPRCYNKGKREEGVTS